MDTKSCLKCGEVKPMREFYAHSFYKDGCMQKCKSCIKKDSKENWERKMQDPEFAEKEAARHREKYHRLGYKDKHKPTKEAKRETMKRYKERFPEMYKAKCAIGHLPKLEKGLNRHHWAYDAPHYKDTITLSIADHNTVHRFLFYDQSTFMYKTKEGELLDTREKHEAYINQILKP